MSPKKSAVAFSLPFFILVIAIKTATFNKNNAVKTVTGSPASLPGKGYCAGSKLGIAITDTSFYRATADAVLPCSIALDMPAAGNQGNQGSCAAWAAVYAAGSYYIHTNTGRPYSDSVNLSPRFIYNQISKGSCSCTAVLDILYLLKTVGACSYDKMPYDHNDCSTQPDSTQFTDAARYRIRGWKKINVHDLNLLKTALAENIPVIFAINTDAGFRKIAPPFTWKERSGAIEQAHSMVICGYDDDKNAFKVMNSWGTRWADKGFAWIDYDFFLANVLDRAYVIV